MSRKKKGKDGLAWGSRKEFYSFMSTNSWASSFEEKNVKTLDLEKIQKGNWEKF